MKIVIATPGKNRDQRIDGLICEYAAKISKNCPFVLDYFSETKNKFGDYLKQRQPGDFVVVCDEKGEEFTSAEFSEFIKGLAENGAKRVLFFVGNFNGFEKYPGVCGDKKIALSKMTLPHEMARLFLCEQIYRAFSILNNSPYHK